MVSERGRRPVCLFLASSAVLLAAEQAAANTFIPFLWPVFEDMTPAIVPLATVLVAVLERPFVTKAGVARRALLHSLAANVISSAAGVLTAFLWASWIDRYHQSNPTGFEFSLLFVAPVVVSIVLETAYYCLVARRWIHVGWIALANVLSTLCVLGLAMAIRILVS